MKMRATARNGYISSTCSERSTRSGRLAPVSSMKFQITGSAIGAGTGKPEFEMDLTVHAEDKYQFVAGLQDIASGQADAANVRFEVAGLAKPYMHYSYVTDPASALGPMWSTPGSRLRTAARQGTVCPATSRPLWPWERPGCLESDPWFRSNEARTLMPTLKVMR
jgi:hypothetical protein